MRALAQVAKSLVPPSLRRKKSTRLARASKESMRKLLVRVVSLLEKNSAGKRRHVGGEGRRRGFGRLPATSLPISLIQRLQVGTTLLETSRRAMLRSLGIKERSPMSRARRRGRKVVSRALDST